MQRYLSYFSRTLLRDLALINWFDSNILTNNFSESFNKKLKGVFAVRHINIWAFVKKIDDMMTDIYLVSLRMYNDLVTTRQRPRDMTMVLSPDLKNQILTGEISELSFLATHLGMQEIFEQISVLFNQAQSVESEGSNQLNGLANSESEESDYELLMPNFEELNFDFDATTSVIHNYDLLDNLKRLDLTHSAPSRECIVCFGSKAGTFAHSCGHASVCFRCTAENLKHYVVGGNQSQYKCPHCRAIVHSFNRIL